MIFFDGEHAYELAASVIEFAELGQFRRRKWSDGGRHEFGEVGDDGGVDGVGLGELAHALGEIADLSGVGDDGG